ncbi:MAG TPA: error-prone DNA polymerase [Frankiaceae bacterium]|nr:error-prone DNA polymerase [Frankiaceae bacterium]
MVGRGGVRLMGFDNPPMPWAELERRLSDRPDGADGGDSPAWSRKREPYVPPVTRVPGTTPYAELHCHSNFSFLDGASSPEELAEEAARLGLEALALTDHDGFYGVVRFAEAARAVGLPTVFGAELSLGLGRPQNGVPDPEGTHLLVLARGLDGYAALARAISEAQLAGAEKGRPVYDWDRLAELHGSGGGAGRWQVLTGCRKGAVPRALATGGRDAAARELIRLVEAFGPDNVAVELWDRAGPLDTERNDALAELARRFGLPCVATNNVHHATPAGHRLATVVAAVRARRSLDEADGWLPAGGAAHLRSGEEQARRFARWPGAVERSVAIARECAFDLALVAPRLPDCDVPEGHTEMSWLRELTMRGAVRPYGTRDAETAPGAYATLDKELAVVEEMGFAGYFLIVRDIVEFCRREDIFCQGRGSAANSAVCYVLGITAVDAVRLKLLFERFLSPHRDGPPDIDLDIENGRREEVIQYVYNRYGRDRAAQVCNVITYRSRSAVREVGRAFGFPEGRLDVWSKQLDHWGRLPELREQHDNDVPAPVLEQAMALQQAPRHLGIHSGGMVVCDRPILEVCPVEWARMPGRTVLQWDKDDCAATGLVKFDLLGLGMLTALHKTFDLLRAHHGVDLDLASIPQEDPEVYEMLSRADSVGVFQVESRAQMATLPRLRPKEFFDLVIEVALIRPGPIQGGSVHPYIRRRHGKEPVTYLHPLMKPALEKTLGVPLFQEQLMQIAVDVAGFSPADADELRMAMGAKRSKARMERLRQRLMEGMAERGVSPDIAEQIYAKLVAFANYGFPESHSVSFAYLVYASAWLKLRYPAAFLAALLNSQPMGFYSPQSLVADAQRHGVVVRGVDVNASRADADIEPDGAVRLGLSYVRSLSAAVAARIEAGRPYASMADLVRRVPLPAAQLEALATAGAFGCFGLDRRAALWAAGAVATATADRLDAVVGADAPPLPAMTALEETIADVWATGVAAERHVVSFVRPYLDEAGAVTAARLRALPDKTRVWVGGAVIHRQRPATAGGTTFVNLEDETGHINVICSPGVWRRFRRVATSAPGLLVRGRLENVEGVANVVADRIEPLSLAVATASRDFH